MDTEENQSAAVVTSVPAVRDASGASEEEIIAGGVDYDAVKIDGTSEKVFVRQLPFSLIPEFGNLQGDEAALIELLCDKSDRSAVYHINNLRAAEYRVQQLMAKAAFEQIEAYEKRLISIRDQITAQEKKQRWSDSLTEEAGVKILELGARLNKKKFERWTKRRAQAAREMAKSAAASLQESSSSSSPASATETSATS